MSFEACDAITAKWEKGKVDHPKDPGGRTNDGVTQATYDAFRRREKLPLRNVYLMEPAEKRAIFHAGYWLPIKGDSLPPGLDLVTYDAAVNSGPKRGVMWLQAGVNAEIDGAVGKGTIAAAIRAAGTLTGGNEAIKAAMRARTAFLRNLKHFATFGRGWMYRVADVEAQAVKMHSALFLGPIVGARLEAEAKLAEQTAAERRRASTTVGAGGAAAGGAGAGLESFPLSVMLPIAALLIVAAVFLARRSTLDRIRSEAFLKLSKET